MPASATTAINPIAAAIEAGKYPQCNLAVGIRTEIVVTGFNKSSGVVDLHCITGSSTGNDKTGAGETTCDPLDAKSDPVYYWASQNAQSPDQNVYAAKKGGTVVIVPNQTAQEFFAVGGGLASVLLAVGSC
jgi:hypothetical protein